MKLKFLLQTDAVSLKEAAFTDRSSAVFRSCWKAVLLLLALVTLASPAQALDINLAWDVPQNPDGSLVENITGYKIHYGNSSRSYTTTLDVGDVLTTTVSNLTVGPNYYFAASTLYDDGEESTFTPELLIETQVSSPTVLPAGGTFTGQVAVTISSDTPDAQIYYTLDGTEPTQSATPYSGPIEVAESLIVRSCGYKTGLTSSADTSASFVVVEPAITFASLAPSANARVDTNTTFAAHVAADLNVASVSLWGNWSGTWQEEATQVMTTPMPELLQNPGFEVFSNGQATDWQVSKDSGMQLAFSEDGAGYEGAAQQIDVVPAGGWGFYFYQTPTLEVGKTYQWTIWYRTTGGLQPSMQLADGPYNNVAFDDELPSTGGAWETVTKVFTHSNANANRLRIFAKSAGSLWLDKFSLREAGSSASPVSEVSVSFPTNLPSGTITWALAAQDGAGSVKWSDTNTVTVIPDADDDGLPDEWELDHFPSLLIANASTSDLDLDNIPDHNEFIAGTDPNDPASYPGVDIARVPGGDLHVSFQTKQADGVGYQGYTRYYTLETCTNIGTAQWEPVPGYEAIPGDNQLFSYDDSFQQTDCMYRMSVRLE